MSDSEMLITVLVTLFGTWSFLRIIGKDKHRRERILEVLHRRELRDIRTRELLEQSPDDS